MTDITPLPQVVSKKPGLEIEIRGKNHTGKTAMTVAIAKVVADNVPGHKINVGSTDCMVKDARAALDADPVAFRERLKDVGAISILDIDNQAQVGDEKAA